MGDMIRTFARRLLHRLQKKPAKSEQANGEVSTNGMGESMEDGETEDETIQTEYLPEHLELPANKAEVLQHVELTFVLCVKCPDLLNE